MAPKTPAAPCPLLDAFDTTYTHILPGGCLWHSATQNLTEPRDFPSYKIILSSKVRCHASAHLVLKLDNSQGKTRKNYIIKTILLNKKKMLRWISKIKTEMQLKKDCEI